MVSVAVTTRATPVVRRRDHPVWCCGARSMAGSLRSLLTAGERVACDVRVPVYERARRVGLPGPHVQGIEPRQPESVRRFELLEYLSHELGRGRMRLVPRVGEHRVIGANQAHLIV